MDEVLSEEVIERFIERHPDWKLTNGKWLVKKYRFENYLNGIEFASEVGQLSESFQHHPYITVNYKLVTVKLTTWSLSGLTQTDLKMAVLFDEAFSKL
ncbi:4a-hydroxytetrahydrobiopterin dehydratase [Fictibacillus sp. KIGAM418]|uniref:4a-hydroxytetrahydrobiopterin dehydratase n=1 Tax=Fictibacillus marinisediminis TaxID=2878389 RepID=A0A9X2BCM7_9BACL|nr:4a-hydroxytetrahydrobiopterin dehydratase [Fictibacillus marinisediminis]MCK6256676.1 4a-hydroxytetrahydrobiopterin dehydratase [Fictibacillus marinisediminis]